MAESRQQTLDAIARIIEETEDLSARCRARLILDQVEGKTEPRPVRAAAASVQRYGRTARKVIGQ